MLETQNQNDSRFNRHHLSFTEDSYKGKYERRFRNHEGLVIPVLRSAHKDLHDWLGPPPKPTAEMMRGCIDTLDQDLTILEINPFYALNAIVNYLDTYKQLIDDTELAAQAQEIQSHLGFQALALSDKTFVAVQQMEQMERLDPGTAITRESQSQTTQG
jgi:hypothetical protein